MHLIEAFGESWTVETRAPPRQMPGVGQAASLLGPGCDALPIECAYLRKGTEGGRRAQTFRPLDHQSMSRPSRGATLKR